MKRNEILLTTSQASQEEARSVSNGLRGRIKFARASRVLYIEDDIFNQEIAKKLFSNIECELHITNSGYEALDLLMKEEFDLIFMDINMPVLNGYDTTMIIRNKLKLETPIIALTNCDSEEDIQMCRQVGMNDYIKKPLSHCQLKHSLSCWTRERLVIE